MKERKPISVGVDIAIEKDGKIVLIRRGNEPFKNEFAFPGGYVEFDETVEDAAIREAKEETGLEVELIDIVGVYSGPDRDPRGSSVAVLFSAKPSGGNLKSGGDAQDAKFFDLSETKKLKVSFDHDKMLGDYLKWREKRGTYWSGR